MNLAAPSRCSSATPWAHRAHCFARARARGLRGSLPSRPRQTLRHTQHASVTTSLRMHANDSMRCDISCRAGVGLRVPRAGRGSGAGKVIPFVGLACALQKRAPLGFGAKLVVLVFQPTVLIGANDSHSIIFMMLPPALSRRC